MSATLWRRISLSVGVALFVSLISFSTDAVAANAKTISLMRAKHVFAAAGFQVLRAESPPDGPHIFSALAPSVDLDWITVLVFASSGAAIQAREGCGLRVDNVDALISTDISKVDKTRAVSALRALGTPSPPRHFRGCPVKIGQPLTVVIKVR